MYRYLETVFSDEESAVMHNFCDESNTSLFVLFGVNMELFQEKGF
jgi:hypothetical protein